MTGRGKFEDGRRAVGPEVGSLTAELVLLVPVIVLFGLVAVALGRYELARDEVADAADAGAVAAASAPAPQAAAAATAAAQPVVSDPSGVCSQSTVRTDAATTSTGSSVEVTVTCSVSIADLGIPGLSGSASVDASATDPIDPYRTAQ